MIVINNPTYEDSESGFLLSGSGGKELDRLLKDAGLFRGNIWITSVVKYYVPPNSFDKKIPFTTRCESVGINIQDSINELREEIKSINPHCILLLGGDSLWAVTGKSKIQNFRGSLLNGFGFKCISTFTPIDLLHEGKGEIQGYWQRQIIIADFKRAREQSSFGELIFPSRNLNVCKNSAQLYDFIQRHKSYDKPAIDIEAKECIPICVGISFNPSEGLTVPLWNTEDLSIIPDGDLVSTWILLSEILFSDVVGQNFGYDRDKIRRLGLIIKRIISDTMMKAFCINPELPKNLAFLTSIYTLEPYYKDEGMYEGSISDLLIGCARDACVTKEIDLIMDIDVSEMGLTDFYNNFLMKLPDLYGDIEQTGLKTNNEHRKILLEKYIKWDELINYQLFQIAGIPINTASPKQVAVFLYESLKIPRRIGTGEEVLTQIINNVKLKPIQKKAIELVLEDRRVKKTIGNYILSPTDFDGRTRTSYFLCLDTGRSATSQQEPPIRPTIEILDYRTHKKKKKSLGSSFQVMTKHGDIGEDVRTIYEPDDGEVFVQIDSSQAEARVIFHLANDDEALTLIDTCDYHALTASWFFGGTEDDYSKKKLGYESPIRFTGKMLRHAGHLGASKRRAAIEVNTQCRKNKIDYSISEGHAEYALKIFHQKQPKIRGVFHHDIIKCLESTRMLEAPVPYGIESQVGGKRIFFERWGEELFRKGFSYLPQRTVTENTKSAALRIKRLAPWIKILIESHDSLLTSLPIPRLKEGIMIMKPEFERPINFANCSLSRGELIIPAEVEIGYNYKELSKYKEL